MVYIKLVKTVEVNRMDQKDKEKILARSREENKGLDERERQLLAQANTVGLVGLLAVFLVLFLIELFVKGGKSYDLLAMLSGFLSVSSFCRYYYIRKKLLLLTGCLWLFCTVVWIALYIWKG